jgi:hypothetical protein
VNYPGRPGELHKQRQCRQNRGWPVRAVPPPSLTAIDADFQCRIWSP